MTASELGVAWPPPIPSSGSMQIGGRNRLHRSTHPMRGTAASAPSIGNVIVLLPLRIFLAAGWTRAGVEKLVDPHWWRGDALRAFLAAHHAQAVPPFRPVLDHLVEPAAVLVAFVVMATELACGLAVGMGRPLRAALRWGVFLNVSFMLSGPVNPSACYLVMEMVLLLAIAEGTIGRTPRRPSARTLAAFGGLVLSAAVLSRYVRTLQPSKVIADPAIMLVFLAVVEASVFAARYFLVSRASHSPGAGMKWGSRMRSFIAAQPARDEPTPNRRRVPDIAMAVGWRRAR